MNFIEWSISTIGTSAFLAFIFWLSRNWILMRMKNSIEHEYKEKLEKYKTNLQADMDKQLFLLQSNANFELEKFKIRIGPYSEKQFERYNELWIRLYELRCSMEDLWGSADEKTLNEFSKNLKDIFQVLEKSALLIEPAHYDELIESLNVFAKYQIGKKSLIDLRKNTKDMHGVEMTEKIGELILKNEHNRNNLKKAMKNLMDNMRSQINGGNL